MAITIDDLPLRVRDTFDKTPLAVVKETIAILKKHGVPQVYGFINGSHMEGGSKLAKQIEAGQTGRQLAQWRRAGYPLGNHTYSHMDFSSVSLEAFRRDIERNEPILKRYAGGSDWHYMRFPFLAYGTDDKRVALFDYLAARGYRIAYASLDFQDWRWIDPYLRCKGKGAPQSIQFMKQLYLENARDALERTEAISHALFNRDVPYILLLHISEFNLHTLDALLRLYEAHGVTFITLEEAMADPVYRQFGMVADRIGRSYANTDIWQSWRGPLALPGLTLDTYDEKPADLLREICQ